MATRLNSTPLDGGKKKNKLKLEEVQQLAQGHTPWVKVEGSTESTLARFRRAD